MSAVSPYCGKDDLHPVFRILFRDAGNELGIKNAPDFVAFIILIIGQRLQQLVPGLFDEVLVLQLHQFRPGADHIVAVHYQDFFLQQDLHLAFSGTQTLRIGSNVAFAENFVHHQSGCNAGIQGFAHGRPSGWSTGHQRIPSTGGKCTFVADDHRQRQRCVPLPVILPGHVGGVDPDTAFFQFFDGAVQVRDAHDRYVLDGACRCFGDGRR